MIFETTPSQTVGPYFAIGLPFDVGPSVVPEGTPGAIHITGTIHDGAEMEGVTADSVINAILAHVPVPR